MQMCCLLSGSAKNNRFTPLVNAGLALSLTLRCHIVHISQSQSHETFAVDDDFSVVPVAHPRPSQIFPEKGLIMEHSSHVL